jgi:hypothetical protein
MRTSFLPASLALYLSACGGSTPAPVAAPPALPPAPPPSVTSAAPAEPAPPVNDRIDPNRPVLKLPPGAKSVARGEDAPAWRYIVVDQFGYRPEMKKVAVLVDPEDGFNGNDAYTPGDTFEIRRWSDAKVVFSGKPAVWGDGKVQKNAGDRGWWFDFSSVTEPGSYFVFDATNGVRSHRFEIGKDVYKDVLKAALRMFYYNRANFEKKKPFACVGNKCWEQGVDYVGPGQDKEARSVFDRTNPKTARDLSGGWWDAGDVNKYVTFARTPVHNLLSAYTEKPKAFGDDNNIPESGNGIPDIIDELKVEFDWLVKMQPKDLKGGVIVKMGNAEHGGPLPGEDKQARFYYPEPCSAGTIAAAGMFAHGSLVFRGFPKFKAFAADLQKRAVLAFDYYQKHDKSIQCDDGTIKAGDADMSLDDQDAESVVAAVYLLAATGDQKYDETIQKHIEKTRPFKDDRWSVYDAHQGEAALYYTTLAKAEPKLKDKIVGQKKQQAASVDLYGFKPDLDLYLAYMRDDTYTWGSNQARANFGNTNYEMVQYGLTADADKKSYVERAEGILHSFHGVNPMQIVYLTNMYAYGGDDCANEIFHSWFRDGDPKFDNAKTSELGPAPGYVTGGANHAYCPAKDHKCHTSLLTRQPSQKAYLDFNTGWAPDKEYDVSWEITEPAIYYQAAYVKILSKFVEQ